MFGEFLCSCCWSVRCEVESGGRVGCSGKEDLECYEKGIVFYVFYIRVVCLDFEWWVGYFGSYERVVEWEI